MIDPTTILALGICLTFISIYNFRFISKWLGQYINTDEENKDKEKLSIDLLTKVPLDVLNKIQNIMLISIPMLFAGIFMIIYSINI